MYPAFLSRNRPAAQPGGRVGVIIASKGLSFLDRRSFENHLSLPHIIVRLHRSIHYISSLYCIYRLFELDREKFGLFKEKSAATTPISRSSASILNFAFASFSSGVSSTPSSPSPFLAPFLPFPPFLPPFCETSRVQSKWENENAEFSKTFGIFPKFFS